MDEKADDLARALNKLSELPIRAFAGATGMSPSAAQRFLAQVSDNGDGTIRVVRKKGMDGRVRPSRRYDTSGRDEEIRRLRKRSPVHWTIRDIATEVGCSVGTVHRVLKRP